MSDLQDQEEEQQPRSKYANQYTLRAGDPRSQAIQRQGVEACRKKFGDDFLSQRLARGRRVMQARYAGTGFYEVVTPLGGMVSHAKRREQLGEEGYREDQRRRGAHPRARAALDAVNARRKAEAEERRRLREQQEQSDPGLPTSS